MTEISNAASSCAVISEKPTAPRLGLAEFHVVASRRQAVLIFRPFSSIGSIVDADTIFDAELNAGNIVSLSKNAGGEWRVRVAVSKLGELADRLSGTHHMMMISPGRKPVIDFRASFHSSHFIACETPSQAMRLAL